MNGVDQIAWPTGKTDGKLGCGAGGERGGEEFGVSMLTKLPSPEWVGVWNGNGETLRWISESWSGKSMSSASGVGFSKSEKDDMDSVGELEKLDI